MIRYYLGRGAADRQRADLPVHVRRRVRLRARSSRRTGAQAGERVAAATASSSATGRRRRNSRRRPRRSAADPRNWVAQPILDLSTAPTLVAEGIAPRHLDLRPFVLTGEHSYVTAGGLTRVALTRGFAHRQLVAGRRQQGHLDRRRSTTTSRPGSRRRRRSAQLGRRPDASQSQCQSQSQSGQSQSPVAVPEPEHRTRRAADPGRSTDGAAVARRRAAVLGRPLHRARRGRLAGAALVR